MRTSSTLLTVSIGLGLVAPLAAQTAGTPRAARVAAEVRWLADDAREGRATCSPGAAAAAEWLAARLAEAGWLPAGDGGGWLQRWTAGRTAAAREAGLAGCRTMNVVGRLPGTGEFSGQAIVLGAHFDHLGRGPFGSREPHAAGAIHNGADDNASGTAAVLEVARLLAAERSSNRPARTVLVALFSGEEAGALGSAFFVANAPFPAESVVAMLNFDMVGRLRERRLLVLGARTAREWPALLDSLNATAGFDLRASGDGWGPSDHASFYARGIPVLHFFTDLHDDYHRPSDDPGGVNADGVVQIADYAAALAGRLRERAERLTFVDAPAPAAAATASAGPVRARPVLGTIPDMTEEPGGVRLSGVRAGSPADSAGLRAGDVLTGLGPFAIANLQDFQRALMAHEPGQVVEVRYRRGVEAHRAMVRLGGREP
jgi:hypothetical protein